MFFLAIPWFIAINAICVSRAAGGVGFGGRGIDGTGAVTTGIRGDVALAFPGLGTLELVFTFTPITVVGCAALNALGSAGAGFGFGGGIAGAGATRASIGGDIALLFTGFSAFAVVLTVTPIAVDRSVAAGGAGGIAGAGFGFGGGVAGAGATTAGIGGDIALSLTAFGAFAVVLTVTPIAVDCSVATLNALCIAGAGLALFFDFH